MKKQAQKAPASTETGSLSRIFRIAWPLLMVSFLEGAALMAVELIGAKLVAPYYGNSIYVWSSVLGTTLGGLALGYFLGGQMAARANVLKSLQLALGIGAVLTALLPFSSTAILELSIGMESLQSGVVVSSLVILAPPLVLFGMVSPMIIQILVKNKPDAGTATGLVYAVSTSGGIMATFWFAFQVMPFWGLRMSCWLAAGLLLMALVFSLSGFMRNLAAED